MHSKSVVIAVFLLITATFALAATPATMRLDYFHTGKSGEQTFSVDRVVIEPLPWPGNPAKAVDDSNLGVYLFEVTDRASGKLLYSRGFASIFGEWATTEEAQRVHRTFHESLRFPAPTAPVKVVMKQRDAQNNFRAVWSTEIDPTDKYIDRSHAPAPAPLIPVEKNGDPATKVDLLFLGEGYSAAESAKCEKDVRRLAEGVFAVSPFKERRKDFNVWAICAASPESGVSHPSVGQYRRTLFDSTFDVFGTERYALSFNNRAIREVASYAPYEFLGIVMNEKEYGNGGIFGQYASVSIDYPTGVSVFVHEFGHHFAGLGDEYYFNANVAYAAVPNKVEPWEPNITALLDPKALKWKSLVNASTPLPTPWPKAEYENSILETQPKVKQMRAEKRPEAEISAFLRGQRKKQESYLNGGDYADKVGAFEGAMYETKGYYRSQQRCIMISGPTFCAACRLALERVIDMYTAN
ncbi:MAG TPA: M64 family metallopeptidase [Terriglobales bacterium]|nr:M64 family metallopeptidase [Terriglobales bacterium]